MTVLIMASSTILAEAKKRSVVIPEIPKRNCAVLKKEAVDNRKLYNEFNKLKISSIVKAENDVKLDLKRAGTTLLTVKKSLLTLANKYKSEEVKPVIDNFNAEVDAAMVKYNTEVDKALSKYKTLVNKLTSNILKGLQKTFANIKKKLVCSGDPLKDKDDSKTAFELRGGGHGDVGRSEAASEIKVEGKQSFLVAIGKAKSNFQIALRAAEKTRNDAIKLLKKVK